MARLLLISENINETGHWFDALNFDYTLRIVSTMNEVGPDQYYDLVIFGPIEADKNFHLPKLSQQFGKVFVVGDNWSSKDQIFAIKQGAFGYSEYSVHPDIIKKAVKSILNDEIWLQRHLIPELIRQLALNSRETRNFNVNLLPENKILKLSCLTKREYEVTELIYQGKQVVEIANLLNIKERTVKAHLSSILNKLEVKDRYQLVVFLKDHHINSLNSL